MYGNIVPQTCSYCDFRGPLRPLVPHEQTHALLSKVNLKLLAMSDFLKHYSFPSDPLFHTNSEAYTSKLREWLSSFPTPDIIFHLIERGGSLPPRDRRVLLPLPGGGEEKKNRVVQIPQSPPMSPAPLPPPHFDAYISSSPSSRSLQYRRRD